MDLEQLHVRNALEDFIEIPDVLYTLLLEFAGPYEWSDLKHIPLGVTCSCILDVIIYMTDAIMMKRNVIKRRWCKVYVTRWKGESMDVFTFRLTIDEKSRELSQGNMAIIRGIHNIEFTTGQFSRVNIIQLKFKP